MLDGSKLTLGAVAVLAAAIGVAGLVSDYDGKEYKRELCSVAETPPEERFMAIMFSCPLP